MVSSAYTAAAIAVATAAVVLNCVNMKKSTTEKPAKPHVATCHSRPLNMQ